MSASDPPFPGRPSARLVACALLAASACGSPPPSTLSDDDPGTQGDESRTQVAGDDPVPDEPHPPRPPLLGLARALCGDNGLALDAARIVDALDDGAELVEVTCRTLAYQVATRYARRLPEGDVVPVGFELPDHPALEGLVDRSSFVPGELVGIPTYDPSAEELVVLSKHRGSGECGVFARFALERRFVLREARAQSCAAADAAREPLLAPDWPPLEL